MMKALNLPIIFELCAETLDACLEGKAGGASRIELCSHLEVGGLTPDPGLVVQVVQQSGLPVHVMVRPRAGNFFYSDAEFDAMCADLQALRPLGIAGVVFGILHEDRAVDVERTRQLVELAAPLSVTFHRAFDETPDIFAALEVVIDAGCDRILTSGGAPDVLAGAMVLGELVARADGRIAIAVGGGLRLGNAELVAGTTWATHFHGTIRRPAVGDGIPVSGSAAEIAEVIATLEAGLSSTLR
jgi:copper homeostasis protein